MNNQTTTTEAAQNLVAGQVLIFNDEPLPIYKNSSFYVPRGRVVPDGNVWVKALTSDGEFALTKNEASFLTKNVLDANGNKVLCIAGEYPYITAQNTHRDSIYFIDERAAEANNFKFSFRLSRFHDANCDSFYGDEKLLDYHTASNRIDRSRLPKFHSDSDEYLCGIEVEKVDSRLQDEGEAWEILERTGWSKERDGSLGDGGYEFVSPILPLFNTEVIVRSAKTVGKWINGKSSDKCGGHITLSKRGLPANELLESFKSFAPILYALYPARLNNHFCKAKQWNKYFSYPEKYSAFYLKDGHSEGGRVEIRIPSRVVNEGTLYWRIELLQLLIKDGGNLNQLCQKIGCPESILYKHFAKQYDNTGIGDKLLLIDKYAKQYGTHRNGISPSVKKRINNTIGYDLFD
jgi:hypothetical protein